VFDAVVNGRDTAAALDAAVIGIAAPDAAIGMPA
jgi:hypothetical protein